MTEEKGIVNRRTYDQKAAEGKDPRYDPERDLDYHPDLEVPPGHHLSRPNQKRGAVVLKDSFVEEGSVEEEERVVVVPPGKVLEVKETPEGNMLVIQLQDEQETVVTLPELSIAPINTAQSNICGAMTRHGPCQSHFIMANGRCRAHGGASKGLKSCLLYTSDAADE